MLRGTYEHFHVENTLMNISSIGRGSLFVFIIQVLAHNQILQAEARQNSSGTGLCSARLFKGIVWGVCGQVA